MKTPAYAGVLSLFCSKRPVNAGVCFLNFACAMTSKNSSLPRQIQTRREAMAAHIKRAANAHDHRYANVLIRGGGFGGCFGFFGSLPRLSRLPMAISSKIKQDAVKVQFSYAANNFARAKSIAVNGVRNFVCAVSMQTANHATNHVTNHAAIFSVTISPKRKLDATIPPNTRSS